MGNILQNKLSTGYGIVGGQPLKPDKILYCLLGGVVTYAIKGIGIFEWFWAEGQGMIGLVLKASKIEISISSVAFVHRMRPLENVTSPRYLLPLALALDFFRICCSLGVNFTRRRNNDEDNNNKYSTIKKVVEIVIGYLLGYLVVFVYVTCFVTVEKYPVIKDGQEQGLGINMMSGQGYGVLFKSCLASVIGCCMSEGISRLVLGNV